VPSGIVTDTFWVSPTPNVAGSGDHRAALTGDAQASHPAAAIGNPEAIARRTSLLGGETLPGRKTLSRTIIPSRNISPAGTIPASDTIPAERPRPAPASRRRRTRLVRPTRYGLQAIAASRTSV
jgi:hypothetical protein